MPVLRPYQIDLVQRVTASLRAGHNPLAVLPTGGGKMVCLASIVHYCAKHPTARILLLAHRDRLIQQLSQQLTLWRVPHATLQAGDKTPTARIVIAMVQTVTRRRLPPFDLIIVDEVHHATSTSYLRIFEQSPRALICGWTATPMRLSGEGLGRPDGRAKRRKGVFDELIVGPSMAELTTDGWLAPLRCYAPDAAAARKKYKGVRINAGDFIMADAAKVQLSDPVLRYRELICEGGQPKPALSFDCTVESARETASIFVAAGYKAAAIDGSTPDGKRDRLLRELASGELHLLSSCEVIGEGLDIPNIAGILLRRPTKSVVVHYQQIGRATRTAPGKPYAVIVDMTGDRFFQFGDPYSPIPWSLDGRPEKQDEEAGVAPLRDCPGCGVLIPLGMRVCKYCGFELPQSEVAIEVELVDKAVLIADFGHKPFETPSATVERVRAHFAGKLPESWPRGGSALLRWAQIADALLAKDNDRATRLVRDFGFKIGFLWFMRKSLWEKPALQAVLGE